MRYDFEAVAVTRSRSGGVTIRYVFPVLQMTSYLHAIGQTKAKQTGHTTPETAPRSREAESDAHDCLLCSRHSAIRPSVCLSRSAAA